MRDITRPLSVAAFCFVAAVASCGLDSGGLQYGVLTGASSSGVGGAGSTSTVTASVGEGGGTAGIGGGSSISNGGGGPGVGGAGGATGAGGMTDINCGNGIVDPPESCDDSNTKDGDGCSAECMTEPSPTCPGNQVVLTPAASVTLIGTLGSQGDDINPGCGPGGLKDAVYAVTPTATGTMTAMFTIDGDKSMSIRSACPGSVVGGEITCKSGPPALTQELWVQAGQTYFVVVDAPDNENYSLVLSLTACGDNLVNGLEQCDNQADKACVGCVLCNGAGEFWDPATKHCYRLVDPVQSWQKGRDDCIAWGGDLAGISSKSEFNFLAGHMSPAISADTWIGGHATTPLCSYVWVNGEPWRSEWADNEPSGSSDLCIQMWQTQAKKLDDTGCDNQKPYLCERTPAGYCGDGIIQPGELCDDGNTMGGDGCSAVCRPDNPCLSMPGYFEDPATQHCYWKPAGTAIYKDAKNACEMQGGYLTVIESQAEDDLVKQNISADTWIGGVQGGLDDATVIWEAPTAGACAFNAFDDLNQHDSNEDCVRMINGTGKWHDSGCDNKFSYICERNY